MGIVRPLALDFAALSFAVRVHAASLGSDLRRGNNRLPSGQALENALGILDQAHEPQQFSIIWTDRIATEENEAALVIRRGKNSCAAT